MRVGVLPTQDGDGVEVLTRAVLEKASCRHWLLFQGPPATTCRQWFLALELTPRHPAVLTALHISARLIEPPEKLQ